MFVSDNLIICKIKYEVCGCMAECDMCVFTMLPKSIGIYQLIPVVFLPKVEGQCSVWFHFLVFSSFSVAQFKGYLQDQHHVIAYTALNAVEWIPCTVTTSGNRKKTKLEPLTTVITGEGGLRFYFIQWGFEMYIDLFLNEGQKTALFIQN